MLLDRNKHIESAYIGEELFSDPQKDRLHRCMVVEQTIADGDFSVEEALTAYQVSREEYEDFIAKKSNSNIRLSISGTTTMIYTSPMYFDVIVKMLDDSFEPAAMKIISKHVKRIKSELNHISKEMEQFKEKV